uniref:C2H2-type domain-containing protein n=2 Tax=Iconisemion striatum TaxID=60296 RepID=A0A1A7WAJ3_9TELE
MNDNMARNNKDSPLPPASLQLLVPPVRLMSAFMWNMVLQDGVKQYNHLLEYISLTTEIVPELLSPNQKAQLILGLRAKLVLELCRGDGVANLKTIQDHLDKIHSCCVELSNSDDQMDSSDILKMSYSNFASLVQSILNVPMEKELFFKQVFPENYGSAFNQRIQQLVSLFLSRLEELLPIPNLQQTALWVSESFSSEEFVHYLKEQFPLKSLLLHHRALDTLSSACSNNEENIIFSTLAFSNQTEHLIEVDVHKYDSEEDILTLEDLEEDSSHDTDNSDEWIPKNKSDCPSPLDQMSKSPSKQRSQKTVQKHIKCRLHKTAPSRKNKSVKKVKTENLLKSPASKRKNKNQDDETKSRRRGKHKESVEKKNEQERKEGSSKKKSRQSPKEPTGEDKRFLSTRPVIKNFTEEDIKCSTCEKVFEHPNQLKNHIKLHSFQYICIQCEKGYESQSKLHNHQKLHNKGPKVTCELCNKGFSCSKSLKQHECLQDGTTNLCSICDKNFSKSGFQRHMQMHRGERNFLCTTCGKTFLSSGELVLHNRTHTGELPYTCVHCGKGLSCKSHLIVHTRSHTGERPYLCSECPKRFLTLNCLKRHSLSHNGVKPFKCTKCEREFSQQGNLKRHLVVHKNDT